MLFATVINCRTGLIFVNIFISRDIQGTSGEMETGETEEERRDVC